MDSNKWVKIGEGRCYSEWKFILKTDKLPPDEEIKKLFETAPSHNFRSSKFDHDGANHVITLWATLDTSD